MQESPGLKPEWFVAINLFFLKNGAFCQKQVSPEFSHKWKIVGSFCRHC